MPDPLSITTGVLTLLQITVTVVNELKKLHDGASVVHQTISDLANNVDSLRIVLESMRDTFEGITALHGSGHIASLWDNVARSIEDGKRVLGQMESVVQEINRETSLLDEYRKQLRLDRAAERIAGFRMHVQSYRDGLQLSLQAIILWNQMSYQRTADEVLPNLANLHNDVRRIASDLNGRIDTLQAMVSSQQDQTQVNAMSNLRECVRAAASTISSATTIITSTLERDGDHTVAASDFGDCFPPQHNLAMRRWMDARTVDEYDDVAEQALPPQSVADVTVLDDIDGGSDSDAELESEMTRLLLENGKQRLSTGDSKGAEKMLRNCLGRLVTVGPTRRRKQALIHLDVVDQLYWICVKQHRWTAAQEMLLQRMAIRERLSGKEDLDFLFDVLSLARLMMKQKDTMGARLHARRALKGFKKLENSEETKDCLTLLILLCEFDGNENDATAYAVMLQELRRDNNKIQETPASDEKVLTEGSLTPTRSANAGNRPPYTESRIKTVGVAQPAGPGSGTIIHQAHLTKSLRAPAPPLDRDRPGETDCGDMPNKTSESKLPISGPTSSETSSLTLTPATKPQVGQYSKGLSNIGPVVQRKIIVVGDSAIGKTTLLLKFCKGTFVKPDVTFFENFVADISVDRKEVELSLCDTTGMDDYLRLLAYPGSHVVLICFDISRPSSLDNVQDKWISEVRQFCPALPIFLLGLKLDLRHDVVTTHKLSKMNQRPATREQGKDAKRKIGADRYFECSAKTGVGVREVFEAAARHALTGRADKKKRKSLRDRFLQPKSS
jgi:small GTP-binding protein